MNGGPFDPAANEAAPKPGWPIAVGICAILIGLVAFPISWLPLLNILGMPLSLLRLFVSAVGFLGCLLAKGRGLGLNIIGGGLCVLSLAVAISINVAMVQTSRDIAAQKAAAMPPPTTGGGTTSPNADTETTATAMLGELQVSLTSTRAEPSPAGARRLLIQVEITNTRQTGDATYRTWADPLDSDGAAATLKDDAGQVYPPVEPAEGEVIEGRLDKANLAPGGTVLDVLAFEAPPETVEFMLLDLPGRHLGESGRIQLKINAADVIRGEE